MKWLKICLILVIGSVAFCALSQVYILDARSDVVSRFKSEWKEKLYACSRMEEVQALPQGSKTTHLDVRRFRDGSWLAAAWHSGHDETTGIGEWDGAVLRDSLDGLYWTERHFCGVEGFEAEFLKTDDRSLAEFYQHRNLPKTPLR